MTGKKAPITSQMDFGYDFILKTFQAKNLQWMELLTQSYWYQQVQGEMKEAKEQVTKLEGQIQSLGLSEQQIKTCQARADAEVKVKTAVNAAKKEAQRSLESMKNKQCGPAWNQMWANYLSYKILQKELIKQQQYVESLESVHLTKVEPAIALLQSWGFLNKDKTLTELGILGSEINEGQPILMAKAFQEGVWKGMTQEDFVAFLAGFLGEGKTNDETHPEDLQISDKTRNALNFVDDMAYRCREQEEKTQICLAKQGFWEIHTTWIEPLQRWLDEEEAAVICSEYGLYEGNFLRSVLKVANMVEEWISLATFTKEVELLTLLEGIQEKLVRGIVKPESLYLTLE